MYPRECKKSFKASVEPPRTATERSQLVILGELEPEVVKVDIRGKVLELMQNDPKLGEPPAYGVEAPPSVNIGGAQHQEIVDIAASEDSRSRELWGSMSIFNQRRLPWQTNTVKHVGDHPSSIP